MLTGFSSCLLAAANILTWISLEGPAFRGAAELLFWGAAVAVPLVLLVRSRRQIESIRRVVSLVAIFVAVTGLVHALRTLPAINSWLGAGLTVAVVWGAAIVLMRGFPRALATVHDTAANEDSERLGVLEAAVMASGDGVMIAEAQCDGDTGLRVVYANPAFEQMMGYSIQEAIGMSPSVFCHTDSAVHRFGESPAAIDAEAKEEAEAVEVIRAALRGRESVRLELPGRRKDGTRIWAEWQIVPVSDGKGRFTHWVAILRDTTERRRLEMQLRESQKLEAIGRLAGGIAHDFNNLLTVIRGNAELLGDPDCDHGSDPELLDDIRGAAERAAGLVRQLLTFGRRQTARPEVLDLNNVVIDMAGILRRLLGERVAVSTQLASSPVPVRIDRSQLEQVLINLAVNARDAMPKGGTLLIMTASLSDPRTSPGQKPARLARLIVADTGVGMTSEVRSRIFEPFFTTKDQGTGLGLPTVYGIIMQAGGRIAVDSTVGHGSSFQVDLPWCEEPIGSKTRILALGGKSREAGTGVGRTVLLVEDEDAVRKFAKTTLASSGYTVHEAENGEAALELLAAGQPLDLLVTDLTMPGMGGRELAERVRDSRPEVGVVFISGYAADIARLDSVPAAIFLAKPFTPADLLKAASRAMARAANRLSPTA